MDDKPMTAAEVAELYGVDKVTVYRWVKTGQFDAGVVTTFPGAVRDRVIFDRALTLAQHEREAATSKGETR